MRVYNNMIGLIMAGGKNTRMNIANEKLLLIYKLPLISHVINALKNSKCFSRIIAVTSTNCKKTRNLITKSEIEIFNTTGTGYAYDLNLVLTKLNDYVFIVSGDMALLDKQIVKKIIKYYDVGNIWTSYLVTKDFLSALQIVNTDSVIFKNKTCFFTGVSIVNSQKISNINYIKENYVILNDRRIAVNINTMSDYINHCFLKSYHIYLLKNL